MLSIGIVGLPNVGKSTLFNVLTDGDALAANYPFATIEPNTGVVPVPDVRLQKLAEIYDTQKIIPATINLVDIAGLVAGASKGEGLGNQFLAHIRTCNAILQVVRAFDNGDVLRSDSSKDPSHDIDIIKTELILADINTVNNRLPKLQKESRINPKLSDTYTLLCEISELLNSGSALWENSELHSKYNELLSDLQLLTAKPVIYLFNIDEKDLTNDTLKNELQQIVNPAKALFVCAKLEDELRSLDEHDQIEMLQSYGQNESGLSQVVNASYDILGLQSYLTAGEKEVRAWTIKKGSTAPQAAGVIHGDFEKGFIAAQIIDYEDLAELQSEQAVKQAGKVRTEGKTYVMKPNDVVEFRFNV